MTRELVTVTIKTPYPELAPIDEINLDPKITGVSFDTDFGGFGRLRVGYLAHTQDAGGMRRVHAFLPDPVEAPDMAHVEVRYGGTKVYEGVLVRVLPNRTGFEAVGYGQWAPKYGTITLGGPIEVTSGGIVAEAIDSVPWLITGEIIDPQIRHLWSDVQDRKCSDVISQMANEGGELEGLRVPWTFTVYEDRLARFVPLIPESPPMLTLSYDPDTMEIGWDYEERIDAVRMTFRDRNREVGRTTGAAPSSQGWIYRAGVDGTNPYLRREHMTASADSPHVAMALALRHLDEHSDVLIAGSIMFENWEQILLRYGDTVEVEGCGANVLTQTQVDLFNGVTRAVMGQPPRSTLQSFMRSMDRARYLGQSKVDPLSLGIWRF